MEGRALIQSLNFPLSSYSLCPFGSWEAVCGPLRALGLDGLELVADPSNLPEELPYGDTSGYHMTFFSDWLDFYRGDEAAVLRKFGSWEAAEGVFGGRTPEDLLQRFREDLALGRSFGTPYMVFHVSDVSIEENYTYRWLHSDYEVMDAAIEVLNTLLRDTPPEFELLVENQWWPGFTFTEPEKTEYLLSRIDYPRKGIMLDTGHLMNCDRSIRSQADGVRFILRMLEKHGALAKAVRGVHFHQSVSGRYVRTHTGALPADFNGDYLHDMSICYPHIQRIDRHLPWTDPDCARILEYISPAYLTHELSSGPRRSQLSALRRQLGTLKKANWNPSP